MIPSLRKKHKLIWPFLGIIMIVLFIWSYTSRPNNVLYEGLTYNSLETQLPNLNESISNQIQRITYNLRSNDKHERQIEVVIDKPLEYPSSILVVRGYNYGDEFVRQSLGAKGIYRWTWQDSFELAYEVNLIDDINNIELDNFNLKLGDLLIDHHH